MGRRASLARPARASARRVRALGGVAASLVVLAGRAVAAGSADAAPPSAEAPQAPADAAAGDQAQGAAAQRAAQELEVRVIELRRALDAMERQRASFEDVRRRLDELEARQAAARRRAAEDWTSAEGAGSESLRFSQNGLAFRSPGNQFLVRPGLRLQGLYEADLATTGAADAARPDSSTFRLAHAELLFEGHVASSRFEYRFELDFTDAQQPGIVKDAFVQWRLGRAVAVRVGQFKVPFGLETQYWNALLELVDVAGATSAFTLDRDVGVMVVGRPLAGRLQYHLSASNGPRAPCPQNVDGVRCDEVDLAYAGRIVAAPFGPLPAFEGDLSGQERPLLSVGVSGAYLLLPTDVRARTGDATAPLDVDHDAHVDNVGVWQGAAELRAMFRGASVQAEWLGRREHPGAGGADRTYWGAYGQASYFVLPGRLQAVARVGRTDLPLYGASVAERLARGSRTTEETGGLNAYLRGHDAKLQVDYTHLATPDAGSAPTVHRLRAAVQLAF
ncbi:MAG TPA: porin [Polyangia bacterium]|nr:porin [Polyangia bacterium]